MVARFGLLMYDLLQSFRRNIDSLHSAYIRVKSSVMSNGDNKYLSTVRGPGGDPPGLTNTTTDLPGECYVSIFGEAESGQCGD